MFSDHDNQSNAAAAAPAPESETVPNNAHTETNSTLESAAQQTARAAASLQRYLEDRSSMVKTFALQGLADLARQDAQLREPARRIIEERLRTGTAAMKARARKLLKELQI